MYTKLFKVATLSLLFLISDAIYCMSMKSIFNQSNMVEYTQHFISCAVLPATIAYNSKKSPIKMIEAKECLTFLLIPGFARILGHKLGEQYFPSYKVWSGAFVGRMVLGFLGSGLAEIISQEKPKISGILTSGFVIPCFAELIYWVEKKMIPRYNQYAQSKNK